jgi:hypothetical protein
MVSIAMPTLGLSLLDETVAALSGAGEIDPDLPPEFAENLANP